MQQEQNESLDRELREYYGFGRHRMLVSTVGDDLNALRSILDQHAESTLLNLNGFFRASDQKKAFKFFDVLRDYNHFKLLNLAICAFSSKDIDSLCTLMSENDAIEILDLTNCTGFSADELRQLFDAMGRHGRLTALSLEGISGVALAQQSFLAMLAKNPNLVYLNLNNVAFDVTNPSGIFDALFSLPRLLTLDITRLHWSDEPAVCSALVGSMRNNTHIIRLDGVDNIQGCAQALAPALKRNRRQYNLAIAQAIAMLEGMRQGNRVVQNCSGQKVVLPKQIYQHICDTFFRSVAFYYDFDVQQSLQRNDCREALPLTLKESIELSIQRIEHQRPLRHVHYNHVIHAMGLQQALYQGGLVVQGPTDPLLLPREVVNIIMEYTQAKPGYFSDHPALWSGVARSLTALNDRHEKLALLTRAFDAPCIIDDMASMSLYEGRVTFRPLIEWHTLWQCRQSNYLQRKFMSDPDYTARHTRIQLWFEMMMSLAELEDCVDELQQRLDDSIREWHIEQYRNACCVLSTLIDKVKGLLLDNQESIKNGTIELQTKAGIRDAYDEVLEDPVALQVNFDALDTMAGWFGFFNRPNQRKTPREQVQMAMLSTLKCLNVLALGPTIDLADIDSGSR